MAYCWTHIASTPPVSDHNPMHHLREERLLPRRPCFTFRGRHAVGVSGVHSRDCDCRRIAQEAIRPSDKEVN